MIPTKVLERHEILEATVRFLAHELFTVKVLVFRRIRVIPIIDVSGHDELGYSSNPAGKSWNEPSFASNPAAGCLDTLPISCFRVFDEVVLVGDFEGIVVVERPTKNPGHAASDQYGKYVTAQSILATGLGVGRLRVEV